MRTKSAKEIQLVHLFITRSPGAHDTRGERYTVSGAALPGAEIDVCSLMIGLLPMLALPYLFILQRGVSDGLEPLNRFPTKAELV